MSRCTWCPTRWRTTRRWSRPWGSGRSRGATSTGSPGSLSGCARMHACLVPTSRATSGGAYILHIRQHIHPRAWSFPWAGCRAAPGGPPRVPLPASRAEDTAGAHAAPSARPPSPRLRLHLQVLPPLSIPTCFCIHTLHPRTLGHGWHFCMYLPMTLCCLMVLGDQIACPMTSQPGYIVGLPRTPCSCSCVAAKHCEGGTLHHGLFWDAWYP